MKRFVLIFAGIGLAVPIGLLSLWNLTETYREDLTLLLWPTYAITFISTQASESALLLDAAAIAANVGFYALLGAAVWGLRRSLQRRSG